MKYAELWLRYTAIGVGIICLLWLPVEDTNELVATLIASAVSALFAARAWINNRQSLTKYALHGALAGAAVTPIALFLIAFKTGIHSHGFPDFTAESIMAVLQNTPLFVAGGLLVGLVIGAVSNSRER